MAIKEREIKFIRILDGWNGVTIKYNEKNDNPSWVMECIISPQKKVYRRAAAWEKPHLVIDANILPAEHHIRLVRIKEPLIIKLALRQCKKLIRLRGK
jgi:hypothetical protein